MARAGAPAPLIPWWQLRIELLDVSPKVWRRLIIPEDIKLPKLDRILQICMGWTNSHLHQFVLGGKHYSYYDPEWSAELKHLDEKRIVLSKAIGYECRCFDYIYDFGDSWHHTVIVEDLQHRSTAYRRRYPPHRGRSSPGGTGSPERETA